MIIDNRNKVLITAIFAVFAGSLMGSSVNVALPGISQEFNIGAAALPWISTAFFLASAILLLPGGRLADILGARRIFTIGLVILMAGSISCGLSISELMLIMSRALQGLGQALIATSATVVVVSTFPPKESGRALGTFLAAIYVGHTIGPLVGGVLTEYLGWRSIFLINIPLGSVSLFLLWQLRKVPEKAAGGKFDTIGGLIFGMAICLTIYGFTQLPGQSGILIAGGGLAFLAAFIWWEKRATSPLMNLNLFKDNPTFVFSSLTAFINYCATFSLGMIISLYLQYIQGFSPKNAGLFLGVIPLIQATLTPLVGRLSDRINSRNIATAGMLLTTIGLTLLSFISFETNLFYVGTALAIIGLGLALFVTPNTKAILKSVPSSSSGVASATLTIMRQFGGMIGLAIVTIIFSLLIGQVKISPQYYPDFLKGIQIALGISAALSFIGIFASYARGNKPSN